MVGHFKKTYLHGPIKILQFLTPARIQKRLTEALLAIHHLTAESHMPFHVYLHVIPVCIIDSCIKESISTLMISSLNPEMNYYLISKN